MGLQFLKKQKKDSRVTIIVLLVVLLSLYTAFMPLQTFCATEKIFTISQDLDKSVVSELNEIDFTGFNAVIEDFNESNTNIFAIDSVKNKVYSIISGETAVNYDNFFAALFSNVLEMVLKYLPILSILIGIGVISNLLNGFKSKFNEKSTANLINFVCFFASVTIIVGVIQSLMTSTGQAIDKMVSQINILFPIMLIVMAPPLLETTNSVSSTSLCFFCICLCIF